MDSVGSRRPGTPVRRWYRVLGYIPGVLVGGGMCVTHAYGISGARRGGPCQKSGAHRHAQRPPGPCVGGCAWPIGLGRIPGGPKVPRGGAFVCISAISGVPGRGGNVPPKPVQNRLSVIQQKNLFQFSCGCFSSVVYCSLPIKKKAALAVKKGGLPFRDKHSAVEPGAHTQIAQCTPRREKLI